MNTTGTVSNDLYERMWSRVMPEPNSGCWIWMGSLSGKGYASISVDQKTRKASRVMYEVAHHPPGPLFVLHKCDNRLCINPAHLFLGTNRDNINDMISKGRQRKGTQITGSKLNAELALEIFKSKSSGWALSKKYGVTHLSIMDIKHGRSWKHVTGAQNVSS